MAEEKFGRETGGTVVQMPRAEAADARVSRLARA
jgi:hypothetical protein